MIYQSFQRKNVGASKRSAFIEIVKEKVTESKHLSVRNIAESVNISKDSVRRILKKDLGLRKLKLRWVPFSLNQNQKNQRVTISQKILNLLSNPNKQWKIITGDESWFYFNSYHDSEWVSDKSQVSVAINKKISSKKAMFTIFFSYQGFHLIEVKGDDYNFDSYYACLLIERLKNNIEWFYPMFTIRGMMLHWDNASSHKSFMTRNKIESVGFVEVEHTPYSPDIAHVIFFSLDTSRIS